MDSFKPEKPFGNIEYKSSLINPTESRIEELATQMKFRADEGNGVAIYHIGIRDNGEKKGLIKFDIEKSIENLRKIAEKIQFELQIIYIKKLENGLYISKCKVNPTNKIIHDVSIAVAGNVDSGKSSTIGVITSGKFDNGRGLARVNVMNHRHEIETGRTSSVGHQIIGFGKNYQIIRGSWQEIVLKSNKIVTFFDLAGHRKYLNNIKWIF